MSSEPPAKARGRVGPGASWWLSAEGFSEAHMADCRDYNDVTREQLGKLKQKLQQMGITPPEGDNGTIEAMGVKLTVAYNEGGQRLTVCIVEKPAFVPESMVWGQIEGSLRA